MTLTLPYSNKGKGRFPERPSAPSHQCPENDGVPPSVRRGNLGGSFTAPAGSGLGPSPCDPRLHQVRVTLGGRHWAPLTLSSHLQTRGGGLARAAQTATNHFLPPCSTPSQSLSPPPPTSPGPTGRNSGASRGPVPTGHLGRPVTKPRSGNVRRCHQKKEGNRPPKERS